MKDTVGAFAPGRIEFLGNHLDYNGGTVLGTATNAGVYGLARPEIDSSFSLLSKSFEGNEITGSINQVEKQVGQKSWGNYCLGVLVALQKRNLAPTHGFSLVLTTDLPISAGLSSSAALELATAQCLLQLAKKKVKRKELVNICREAENNWVGLPCGILDQGTSAFGEVDKIVQINCSDQAYSTFTLPSNTGFWVFDTGIKHDLIDSLYGIRNQECQEALKLLKNSFSELNYLAHAERGMIEKTELPENLKKRSLHVIEEQDRVNKFADGLKKRKQSLELGHFLTDSHRSSSLLFENSLPELDFLVDSLTTKKGVFGARLTGGGFGGAVLAWTSNEFKEEDASEVAQSYWGKWGNLPSFQKFLPSKGACPIDPLEKTSF